jgi:hypothetical protein
MGYAVLNSGGLLPCADTDMNGDEDCGGATTIDPEGGVPWQDLGLSEAEVLDAWASRIRYRVDKKYTSYTGNVELACPPDTISNLRVNEYDGTTVTDIAVAVLVSYGKNKTANGENDNGDAVYTQNTPIPDAFDDITEFLPKTLLLPPLVNAGRWPLTACP